MSASFDRPLPRLMSSSVRAQEIQLMDINKSSEVFGQIARVVNELKMSKQSVTIFKVHELTGIDKYVIFLYFYENGLLKGK